VVDVQKLKKERVQVLKILKELILEHDAQTEKFKREIIRMLARKRAVPDAKDLERLTKMLIPLTTSIDPLVRTIDQGFVE